jgi:hypothetical protein
VNPERFTAGVTAALRAAGWFPGRRLEADVLAAVRQEVARHEGRFGGRLGDFPAASQVLTEFGGLTIDPPAAGRDLAPRPFALDPTMAAHSVDTLIDAGRAIGTGLYPLGVEGLDDAVLAINVLGQVFAIDAAGEWFLGDTIEAALDTLVTGRQPARVSDDGRWPGRVWNETAGEDPADRLPVGAHKRPVGAAFFLPRTPANLHDVWLPDTLTRIGTVPQADPVEPAILTVEWGGLDCEAHVLDLPHFTVLVLAFDHTRLMDQIAEVQGLGNGNGTDTSPLAQAFRTACLALAADLDVAFVQTRQTHHLLRFVAEQELKVRTADSAALAAEGLSLLYLSEAFASGVSLEARDELPVGGGRLVFAGTGAQRW